MITPLDLEAKKFESAAFGYKKSDVDDFMECLIPDYEALYKENIKLNERISELEGRLETYKTMEDTMKNTLIVAQNTAEDLQKAANEKADIIIKEAKAEAGKIALEANEGVKQANEKIEQIKREMDIFVSHSIGALKAQLELFEKYNK